jgi:hypothetical protein
VSYIGASLLVIGFLVLAGALGLVRRARRAFAQAAAALADLSDAGLDDRDKERRLRRHAVGLAGLFALLVGISAISALAPVGLLWVLDRLGALPYDQSMRVAVSWPFVVGTSVVIVIGVLVLMRRGRPGRKPAIAENRYTAGQRMLHDMVFATAGTQAAIGSLESRACRRTLRRVEARRSVFITALPRAGTTMLLNLLADLPEFAVHRYRDMPFVLCPLLGHRLGAWFGRTDQPRPRAHGDGMMIGLDSPEAFEEMVWRRFWPRHYRSDRILPWAHCDDRAFGRFLDDHMRKIIHLRSDGLPGPARRYLSKNNGNIARLAALASAIDDATVIVLFRDPLQHAASLLRQHRRFLAIHQADSFARRYMAGIGHFDFGANFRPINFGNWLKAHGDADPTQLNFWLRYWIAAYRVAVGQCGPRVKLVSYDRLCGEPGAGLERLGALLDLHDVAALVGRAGELRRPGSHEVDADALDPDARADASDLAGALAQAAAV